jgi:hypothetical protein
MASKVLWHVTMSLDCLITGPDDATDWSSSARRSRIPPWRSSRSPAPSWPGRRCYDVATSRYGGRAGIYGGAWTDRPALRTPSLADRVAGIS